MTLAGNIPFDILPEEWHGEAFIAGGFAACPSLAGDIDLWVSVPTGNSLDGVRLELLNHLIAHGFTFEDQRDAEMNEDIYLGYNQVLDNRKVAVVTGRFHRTFALPIHIIVTNGSPADVLAGFDISTHQVALLNVFAPELTEVFQGNDFTPLGVRPVLIKDTPHSQERLARIEARYAHLRAYQAEQSA